MKNPAPIFSPELIKRVDKVADAFAVLMQAKGADQFNDAMHEMSDEISKILKMAMSSIDTDRSQVRKAVRDALRREIQAAIGIRLAKFIEDINANARSLHSPERLLD